MRSRLARALVTLALAAAPLAIATPASAVEPVTLDADHVVDQAGVLSDAEEARLNERLVALGDESEVDLWVVYVDAFTDPSGAEQWANATAQENNLGPHQYLLAVATQDRAFYLSADSAGPLTETQIASIEQEDIAPRLSGGDWAGAGTAAADGLQEARSGGGTGGGALVVVILLVAIGALVVWALLRRRRKSTGARPVTTPDVPLEELERQAGAALVQTDDAVTASAQELGFARAEFGDAATTEFEQAIAAARAALERAFSLQQQMDDETPDSPEQRRAWYGEILELCRGANASLDEKAEAFDELRGLAKNAPEALVRVQQRHAEVAGRVDEATRHLAELREAYSAAALETIADNPAQASARLAFAESRLGEARTAVAAGDGSEAAVGIRAAEQAVDQAALLEDAVDKLGSDLAAAERNATDLLTELEADLAAAEATPDPDGRLAPVIASTRQNVASARASLTGVQRDPLSAVALLDRANTDIDRALGEVRDAQQRADRAKGLLAQTILQAKAQVSAAEDFISARRGAVGATARTRLAEAGAALVQATRLQQTDPERALGLAQRAAALAGQATQHAQNDVGSFAGGGTAGGGGDIGGMLGGIIIGSLLGGGGGGGGFSGGFGGAGRRSGGIGGSRGRSGGFGGGSRSRRGGGRF